MDLQNNALFSSYAYLECNCSLFRRVRSEICPWSVATLLISELCTRMLAIGSCKSEKRAAYIASRPAVRYLKERLANVDQ